MRKVMLVIDDFKELVHLESLLRRIGFDVLSLGKDILVNDALLRFHPDLVIASAKGRAVDGIKLSQRMKKLSPAPRIALAYQAGNPPTLPQEAQGAVDALIETPVHPLTVIKVLSQLMATPAEPLLAKYEKIAGKGATEIRESAAEKRMKSDAAPVFVHGNKDGEQKQSRHVTGEVSQNEKATRVTSINRNESGKGAGPVTGTQPGAGFKARVVSQQEDEEVTEVDYDETDDSTDGAEATEVTAEWDPVKTPGTAATIRTQRSDSYDYFLTQHDDDKVDGVLPREASLQAMRQLKKDAAPEQESLEQIDAEKRAFAKKLFETEPGALSKKAK